MTYAYKIKELAPPGFELITVEEAKTFLRISHAGDDAVLGGYITAARQFCETYTGQSLITRDYRMHVSKMKKPIDHIEIPKTPLVSVTDIRLVDSQGVETIIPAETYTVDIDLACITFDRAITVSSETTALNIHFTAGHGTSAEDIPEALRQAVLIKTTHLYEFRGDRDDDIPLDVLSSLLHPYKTLQVR